MRIKILRDHYCARCPIVKRSPRSTGVKLLLGVTDVRSWHVLDFGCSNWRNSKYLESLGAYAVRMDAIPDTKPDVVAYPTHLPFRDKAFDVVLYTHVLMFLESKSHWPSALKEAARVIRKYLVLETYAVNHRGAISYTVDELLGLLDGWEVVRRNVRKDMQNLVLTPGRR
jgi:SAM-dependent methyltransferase